MARLPLKLGLSAVVLLAVAFQMLKEPLYLGFGWGRHIQPLGDFPYECRRIEDPRLQACEDMWLSEKTRVLYLACSDPVARAQWLPTNHFFNLTGRSTKDAVVALQIDEPKGDSFEYRALESVGYSGTAGDELLTVVGMNGIDTNVDGMDRVELMVVNQRPSLDPDTGAPFLDQSVMGANSTIELFEVRGGRAEEMHHLHTWADETIATPNRMAMVGSSRQFYVTNSHGPHKVGLKGHLGPLFGSGDVAFCSGGEGCRRVSTGHKFPNGLAQHDGLVYVPESIGASVRVFRIKGDNELELLEVIPIDYSLDNLSVDAKGDIYVAAFPRGVEIYEAFKDPFNSKPKSTILRIRRKEDGSHEWGKMIEDGEGGTLPVATTVVHDAKTGRLFMSIDLEHRFKSVTDGHGASLPQQPEHSPASSSSTQLLQAGRLEQLPPQTLIDELTTLYFSKLYIEAPMQDPARYLASLHRPIHMQPPMCLQYTILALAATLSPERKELALAFYQRARNYIQFDEMKDDGHLIMTIGHAQCFVLLSHFEAKHLWFTRASMSLSRAARLAQMMGLPNLEAADGPMAVLPPPRDWSEKEERRRTLWAIFCTDRLTSSATGWPVIFESSRIQTLLPVSDESFQSGVEESSVSLHDALHDASVRYPPFACRVLVAHLYHECLDHTFKTYTDDGTADDLGKSEFMRNHKRLQSRLELMFAVLPNHLRFSERFESGAAVSVSLCLHSATISLYRYFTARARRNKLDARLISDAETRMLDSAGEIFTIVAHVGDIGTVFVNPSVAFATFMAAIVFIDDYGRSHSGRSEVYLKSLMDLVVLMAENNPITASLAVQLAHELDRTGIDRSALEKVHHLTSKMDPEAVLMGRQNHSTGGTLLCPLHSQPDEGPLP